MGSVVVVVDKFRYEVIKCDGLYYGISCFDESFNIVKTIDNISEDREVVEKFCNMLNSEGIEPCHFEEIYDDYFG